MKEAKAFQISKWEVWEAYQTVKKNRGAAGVDKISLQEFEQHEKDNLYKIWNRMSSGSYFPPAVRRVYIPKGQNGTRPLGIPTVSDRIAQTVVKNRIEPDLDGQFHPNSYGYRPNKSAIDAVGMARKRCWKYDWVLDLDISGFFDNISHELLMKAVKQHVKEKWILLYIRRWIEAPVQEPDGKEISRQKGTPQGGVISPLLANLFLHYAFDKWMGKKLPTIPFERYADDIVCHCASEEQAKIAMVKIQARLKACGLEMHPQKTKIVYCKDGKRRKKYTNVTFDFLGYTFQPRKARTKHGKLYLNFLPAMSKKAMKRIRSQIKAWLIHRQVSRTLEELARWLNPYVQGWFNYYGQFYSSSLYRLCRYLDQRLVRWAQKKYKRLRHRKRRAVEWVRYVSRGNPLFVHWRLNMAG
ncbi:group II intron reverse transcriptase/maturase [Paenibacillus larvae]